MLLLDKYPDNSIDESKMIQYVCLLMDMNMDWWYLKF